MRQGDSAKPCCRARDVALGPRIPFRECGKPRGASQLAGETGVLVDGGGVKVRGTSASCDIGPGNDDRRGN